MQRTESQGPFGQDLNGDRCAYGSQGLGTYGMSFGSEMSDPNMYSPRCGRGTTVEIGDSAHAVFAPHPPSMSYPTGRTDRCVRVVHS